MKRIDNKLLFELVKNSKKSDRELAKILGVSQPTVTRARRRLERESKIKEYTAVPDWAKMGYEIAAFTLVSVSGDSEVAERVEEWLESRHEVLFMSGGEGLGMNGVMVSLHRNYTDFLDFVLSFRREWPTAVKKMSSFLASLKTEKPLMAKPFSFRYLAEA